MQYKLVGNTMPAVEVMFDAPGESMYTQSGGMAWMTEGIKMDTNTKGGLLKGVGRMFAGESLFMATYTAEQAGATYSRPVGCFYKEIFIRIFWRGRFHSSGYNR